jgi:hypothetical protein
MLDQASMKQLLRSSGQVVERRVVMKVADDLAAEAPEVVGVAADRFRREAGFTRIESGTSSGFACGGIGRAEKRCENGCSGGPLDCAGERSLYRPKLPFPVTSRHFLTTPA